MLSRYIVLEINIDMNIHVYVIPPSSSVCSAGLGALIAQKQ